MIEEYVEDFCGILERQNYKYAGDSVFVETVEKFGLNILKQAHEEECLPLTLKAMLSAIDNFYESIYRSCQSDFEITLKTICSHWKLLFSQYARELENSYETI